MALKISRRNAYIIKAHTAYVIQPYQGRKKIIPSWVISAIIKLVKYGWRANLHEMLIWLEWRYNIRASKHTLARELRMRHYKFNVARIV